MAEATAQRDFVFDVAPSPVRANLGHREVATDLPRETIRNFLVARHRLDCSACRIGPQRMAGTFAFQVAAMAA
jgi:hypothetical protein